MVDHEGPDGGQLREGVRPGGDVEAGTLQSRAQVAQHVMTGMVAKGHEEGTKKNAAPRTLPKARGKALGGVHQRVATTDGAQRGLQPSEGSLALGASMARQRHRAPGPRGQRGIQRAGGGVQIPLAREQGPGKPELVEAGRRSAQRAGSLALQAAVGHMRGRHEHMPHVALAQIRQHLGQPGADGTAARASAQDDVGASRGRQLVHQRRDARVPALAGEAPGYDERRT